MVGAKIGSFLGKAIEAYKLAKQTDNILGFVRFVDEAGAIHKVELSAFEKQVRRDFGFDNAKMFQLFGDMQSSDEFAKYLLVNSDQVRAWKVAFSDEVVRRNTAYLEKISDAINPATHNYNSQALKQAYDNAPDKARFVELPSPGFQVPFGGNRILVTDPNIIEQSSSTIAQIRNANGIGASRNIGFLQGQINGQTINPLNPGNFRVSNDGLNSAPIFEPSFVARHVRDLDSEFKLLDDLAQSLGGTSPSGVYPQITGDIRLVSEKAFCASCSRVITEFSNMFPNVNLSLVNGIQ